MAQDPAAAAGGRLPTPPQDIPRPPGARPGAPAPWASLETGARVGLGLSRVTEQLRRAGQGGPAPAPGDPVEAWVDVIPEGLPSARAAAVLVALFEEAGETRVVLTRRSPTLRSHRHEVSFPGGRVEEGEAIPAAALREAAEEVGLAADAVTLIGWLHPVVTFASRSHITPLVATLAARPSLVPNPTEVERVFDVALADLAADGVFHEERWQVRGSDVPASADGSFPVWFYEAEGELIWGATARMLTELLALVLEVGPIPQRPG